MPKYLESSIALSIMDCLGIFTKAMPDIRNDGNKLKDENIWSVKNIVQESDFVVIYSEFDDMKYLASQIVGNKSNIWFCTICGDPTEEGEDYNLNRCLILTTLDANNKKYTVAMADTIQMANMLVIFECFRHFYSGWLPNKISNDQIDVIKFLRTLVNSEDVGEDGGEEKQ